MKLDSNEVSNSSKILDNFLLYGKNCIILSFIIFCLLIIIHFSYKIKPYIIMIISKLNIRLHPFIDQIIKFIKEKIIKFTKEENISFITVIDGFLFHFGVSLICLYFILDIYEEKNDVSKKIILFFYISYSICIFCIVFKTVYSIYSSRLYLSYLYYLDQNNRKVFIFYKTNDMWISSRKDYILCSTKEKDEFNNKTLEYKNNAKKINNCAYKEKILKYIDNIDKYSEYIRVDSQELLDFFGILDNYFKNPSINFNEVELDKLMDKIEKITEIKLIDQNEIQNNKLYPNINNKNKFNKLQ